MSFDTKEANPNRVMEFGTKKMSIHYNKRGCFANLCKFGTGKGSQCCWSTNK